MKGVILAGGKGTRLFPLTDPIPKELLPVYDRPMIVHAVQALIAGGVRDLAFVVHSTSLKLYQRTLQKFDLECTIAWFPERKRGGPSRALLLVKEWIGMEDFAVILGDSVFFNQLPALAEKPAPHMFVMRMRPEENDLAKYGQVKVARGKVVEMVWKPAEVFSDLIQTTVFIFPPDVFARIRAFKERREMHISDLTLQYVRERAMWYSLLPSASYLDCGTVEALFQASARVRAQARQSRV